MTAAANGASAAGPPDQPIPLRPTRPYNPAMEDLPHILVVDDDRRLRDLLQRYLFENGFRVTTAADANEARQRMEAFAFDLLVVDVMMPGETGLQLTQSLRTRTSVPIMLLTALGESEDRIAGLEHGADDYLVKPLRATRIAAAHPDHPAPGAGGGRAGGRGRLRGPAASIPERPICSRTANACA